MQTVFLTLKKKIFLSHCIGKQTPWKRTPSFGGLANVCLFVFEVLALSSFWSVPSVSFPSCLCSVRVYGRFVSSDEKKKGGTRRDNEVLIQRTRHSNPGASSSATPLSVPYRVTDSPQKLSSSEWSVSIYFLWLLYEGTGGKCLIVACYFALLKVIRT